MQLLGFPRMVDLVPQDKKGVARVDHFTFNRDQAQHATFMGQINGDFWARVEEGKYARLIVREKTVMSDTLMERLSNQDVRDNANGRVLIAGLGLGMILHPIVSKPEVTSITVFEKEQDVIDLIAPTLPKQKIEVIRGDIFDYKPATSEKFDTIYFDIWPSRDLENLNEIRKLHNFWKFRVNRANPKCWMNSWFKEQLQAVKREWARW